MRENDEKGWEEISFLLALHCPRPVRFVCIQVTAPTQKHTHGRMLRTDTGTVCCACLMTQTGYDFISSTLKWKPDEYCFMQAPLEVNPRSRITRCKACNNYAFPELFTPKAPTDEHDDQSP